MIENYKGWNELMKVYESLPLWRDKDKKQRRKQWGIFEYQDRMNSLVYLIKKYKPTIIYEIGFNMGHSACLILNNIDKNSNLTTFDICRYGYEIKCYEILKKYFNNIELIIGDTKETLKKQDIDEIDFIFIDGGHDRETVGNDINWALSKIKSNGILLLDDNYAGGVSDVIKETNWNDFNVLEIKSNKMNAYIKK